jgi:hypothetical protein
VPEPISTTRPVAPASMSLRIFPKNSRSMRAWNVS